MWSSVLLACALLSVTSSSLLEHEFNIANYLDVKEWTRIGLQVKQLDGNLPLNDHDEKSEETIEGTTTLETCSKTLNIVASLPLYLRKIFVELAMNDTAATNADDGEGETIDSYKLDVDTTNFTDDEYVGDEDNDLHKLLTDEELATEESTSSPEQLQKIISYLKEDGLTDEQMTAVIKNSLPLATVYRKIASARWIWRRRRRCIVGRYYCLFRPRKIYYGRRVFCCMRPLRFPRIFRVSRRLLCVC